MRLDRLKERLGDQIDLTWKSFLLRTEPKATSREKFVAYTAGWSRMADMEPAAHFRAWASDDPPPTSSLPAQIAWKVMHGYGPEATDRYHHRLLAAYFTENRDISDWSVLASLAAEVGIDRPEFVDAVDTQRDGLAQQVIAEHNEAIDQGITAVPTVVINGVLPIPGAQDVDSYAIWIQRIIDRQ